MEKINEEKLKDVSGGIQYNGQVLRCPYCGEDKLHGRDVKNSDGTWIVRWHCPRCKEDVIDTPRE